MLKDKKMGSMIPQFLLIGCVLFSFMNNAYAGVTSSFIRSEWPSVDIPLDNEVFAVPSGYNAPQQVSFLGYLEYMILYSHSQQAYMSKLWSICDAANTCLSIYDIKYCFV